VALVGEIGFLGMSLNSRMLIVAPNGGVTTQPVADTVRGFAIHPNGALYYVDSRYAGGSAYDYSNTLVALDIGLGGGPGDSFTGVPGSPTVLLDGTVVVPNMTDDTHLQVRFLRPSGAVEVQTVDLPHGHDSATGQVDLSYAAGRAARVACWSRVFGNGTRR